MDCSPQHQAILDRPPASVIHSDPEIMGGTPVFIGTRVPLKNLVDYLDCGHSVDEFLDDFPTVRAAQVQAVMRAIEPNEGSSDGA
jgi:uncharacterized protein (DUF433 family)